jgi:cytochrome b561
LGLARHPAALDRRGADSGAAHPRLVDGASCAAPRPRRDYAWHAALGYDFLALLVVRLLWRWMNPVPALPNDLKPWERYAANIGHIGLYLLMFAGTLSG